MRHSIEIMSSVNILRKILASSIRPRLSEMSLAYYCLPAYFYMLDYEGGLYSYVLI